MIIFKILDIKPKHVMIVIIVRYDFEKVGNTRRLFSPHSRHPAHSRASSFPVVAAGPEGLGPEDPREPAGCRGVPIPFI